MADTNTQPRNLEAIILGTGEFSFSPGAVSAADAQSKGYRDFGNIVTIGFKPEIEIIEHEGSYRGIRRVDKRLATKGLLGYGLKCDELTRDNLRIALGGKDTPALTQAAKSLAAGDVLAFGANPTALNRWYDVLIAASRVRELTSLLVAKTAPKSCVADATLDTLTDNTHGLANGAPVIVGGTAVPAGLVAGTVYYVVASATNAFKVAATVGGPAVDLTSAGTAVTYQALLGEGVDYIADKKLGRVRFLTAQSSDRFPVITAPAINAGDSASLLGLTPLDSLIQSGFGRIVLFDDTHPNKVVYDHADFSCQVSFESGTEMDGKKVAEIDFKILVTDTIGTVYTAE